MHCGKALLKFLAQVKNVPINAFWQHNCTQQFYGYEKYILFSES